MPDGHYKYNPANLDDYKRIVDLANPLRDELVKLRDARKPETRFGSHAPGYDELGAAISHLDLALENTTKGLIFK